MSTAHLALNYRPQGVTGDPQRVARPGLKSLNYISRCSRGMQCAQQRVTRLAACLPSVMQPNCGCLLILTCCNTTKCGLLRARGTTTSVQHPRTFCELAVEWSPT